MRRVELDLNREGELLNIIIHLARYKFSANMLKKTDNVLEIGCGFGYGARLMSEYCKTIHAMDSYKEGVEYAERTFKRDNLLYGHGEFNASFAHTQYDAVVSLEVIEHIAQEEQAGFLQNIIALQPRIAIISTPRFYLGRSENRRKEHLHEFTPEEFRSVLETHFTDVDVYGQNEEIITLRDKHSLSMAWNLIAVCRP